MFFRRRNSDLLRRCPSCRGRLVCPMDWEPCDDAHWHIELRCGDCGHRWELDVHDSRAARFDIELDQDQSALRMTLRRLDLERMAAEVETFAAALSRDLIEPADFAV
jgi:hypothetical protein